MDANVSKWQQEHPWEPSRDSFPQPVPIVSPSDLLNPMLRASDVADKDVPTCAATSSLAAAVKMLAETPAGVLPVLERGNPIGVLTDRSLVGVLAKSGADLAAVSLADAMSRDFRSVRDDAALNQLFDCFDERGVLVLDRSGHVVGMITWRSLAGKLSDRGLGYLLARSAGGTPAAKEVRPAGVRGAVSRSGR